MSKDYSIDRTEDLDVWTKIVMNFRLRLLEFIHLHERSFSYDSFPNHAEIWKIYENFYNNYERTKENLIGITFSHSNNFDNISLKNLKNIIKQKNYRPYFQILDDFLAIHDRSLKIYMTLSERKDLCVDGVQLYFILCSCVVILDDSWHLYPDLSDFYLEMIENCIQMIEKLKKFDENVIRIA